MDKCIIWGVGKDYENIVNQIKYEELKGNLEVVALVSREEEIFTSNYDGYLMITKNGIKDQEFDTIIISSSKFYEEIISEIKALKIGEKQIISGRVFNFPLFDYSRYIKLIKDPVTILSDDCWEIYISCIVFAIYFAFNQYILEKRRIL